MRYTDRIKKGECKRAAIFDLTWGAIWGILISLENAFGTNRYCVWNSMHYLLRIPPARSAYFKNMHLHIPRQTRNFFSVCSWHRLEYPQIAPHAWRRHCTGWYRPFLNLWITLTATSRLNCKQDSHEYRVHIIQILTAHEGNGV